MESLRTAHLDSDPSTGEHAGGGGPDEGGAGAAAVESAYEELWRKLPSSNVYKQETLVGWDVDGPDRSEPERGESPAASTWTGGAGWPALDALLPSGGQDRTETMLAACHLVLQWYLDDLESLVGCCLVEAGDAPDGAGRKARLLPSYVYVEDEDSVESLLEDVRRQLRTDRFLAVEPAGPACRGTVRAPVVFFLGSDDGSGVGDWSPEVLDAGFPGRGVVICDQPGHRDGRGGVWMRPSVAESLGLETFERRYGEVLSALRSGEHALVGEVRGLLGGGEDAPIHHLDEMQRRVIALWAGVLNIDTASLDGASSYFELGGTSLNAFKLVNRVRVELHKDISIRDIVENPTVREFARLLG